MHESISIREAEQADVKLLVEMRKKLQEHMQNNYQELWGRSGSFIRNLDAYYQSKIRKPSAKIYIAFEKDDPEKIVGMALGKILLSDEYDPPRSGRIDDVWVEADHRRMGICEEMVRELVEFFRRNGVYDLVLEYAIYNREAEETWRKMGFHPSIIISTAKIDEVKV